MNEELAPVIEAPVEEEAFTLEDPSFEDIDYSDPKPDPVSEALSRIEQKMTMPSQARPAPEVPTPAGQQSIEEIMERITNEVEGKLEKKYQARDEAARAEEFRKAGIRQAKASYLAKVAGALNKAGIDVEQSQFIRNYASTSLDTMILEAVNSSNGYIGPKEIDYLSKMHWDIFKGELAGYLDKPVVIKKSANVGGAGQALPAAATKVEGSTEVERLMAEYATKKDSMSRVEKFAFANRIKKLGG